MGNTQITTRNAESVVFEALEGRTMMSVAMMTPMVAAEVNTAAPVVHAAKVTVKPKATVKPVKTVTPAVVTNPAVTDKSIKYKSFAGSPLFSAAGPSENDITQGVVGDCYFLATLSSIAKLNPTIIRQDVTTETDGTFDVKMIVSGKKQTVHVNADLPVQTDGELAYAGFGAQNSIWVAVLEKAWAVCRTHANSYGSLEGGWMSEAFSAFGIKSTSTYTVTTAVKLMTMVSTEVSAKHFATFATNDTIQDNASLISDHAYTIDAVNVDATGKPVSLRLRNPWGVDGAGNDGNNDGYVTITAAQAMDNFSGMVTAHV